MLEQQKEFNAWGLSKLAIRNIVVFFIVAQMSAIGYLLRVVFVVEEKRERLEQALVKSKDDAAIKIEQLKKEHENDLKMFNLLIQKQLEIQQRLNRAMQDVNQIRKR